MAGDDDLKNACIQLPAQYAALQKEQFKGILDHSAAFMLRNQILNALLGILDQWNPGGPQSALRTALENLRIDPEEEFNELQLFTCNRRRPRRRCRRAFDNNNAEQRHFQFYFIAADRREKPDSLARGLIVEQILHEEIGELHGNRVDFVPTNQPGRIKTEKLPIGSSLQKSIERFKEYVQRRFNFANTLTRAPILRLHSAKRATSP